MEGWPSRPIPRPADIIRLVTNPVKNVSSAANGNTRNQYPSQFALQVRLGVCYVCDMSGKEIERLFRTATRHAGDAALAAGRTVVVKRGRRIISIGPDGKQEPVKELKRAYFRASKKSFEIK